MPDIAAKCPHCARPLSPGAPEGLCPACLLSSLAELMAEATGEASVPAPPLAAPHGRVGNYELLHELGRGGMGVVFRARDLRLKRDVALKLILTGQLASEAEVKRFQNEAEAAAQLEHPNIVPIYEVGESEGRHFFAMKLMEGGSLADAGGKVGKRESETATSTSHFPTFSSAHGRFEKTAQARPPYAGKEAARLLVCIARGVHHAHERGILHRDLKPGNILLDANSEPMVADFGLARRVEGDSSLTMSGAALGSPNYMAPEQAAGGSRAVTTAADIYSLGAILYELLCGQPPFVAATPLETMRKVVEEEAVPPSLIRGSRRKEAQTLRSNAPSLKGSQSLLTSAAKSVDRDLETICLKCLAKDPARRYATAEALADDLERWLRHEPILARPNSGVERALKWTRRHPARTALIALALLTPAAVITMLLVTGRQLTRERNTAQKQETAARASEGAMRLNLYASDMFLAARALEIGNLRLARRTLIAHIPRAGEEDFRGFEWRHYWHLAQGQQERVLGGFSNAVNSVAFSPDGRWLAAGGGNLVHKWDTTHFALASTFQLDAKALVNSVALSADGSTLWVGDQRGHVSVWRDGLARPLVEFSRGTGFVHLALPAGAAGPIAIGERDATEGEGRGAVALYSVTDLLSGHERGNVLTNSGGLAAFSRNGQWLLTGGGGSPVTLHNLRTGEAQALRMHSLGLMTLALAPDGSKLVTSPSGGHGLDLYDVYPSRLTPLRNVFFSWRCRALAYSPDGRTLAAASFDHTIRLLNVENGGQFQRFDGHADQAMAVAFSPDGKILASASKDGTVRLWDPTASSQDTLKDFRAPFTFSPDQRTVSGANLDAWPALVMRHDLTIPNRPPEPLFLWRTGPFPQLKPDHNGVVRWSLHGEVPAKQQAEFEQFIAGHTNALDISHAGPFPELTRGHNGLLQWRLYGGVSPEQWAKCDQFIDQHGSRLASASAGDGSVVAFANEDGRVRLWHTLSAARLPDLCPEDGRSVGRLALSDDGHALALAAGISNVVSIWATATGTNLLRLPPRADHVTALVFSPNGRTLAVAGDNATVQLRDVRTGELAATLAGHEIPVKAMAVSPDGRTLATQAGDGVKLWHLPTQREVGTLAHGLAILSAGDWHLAFSPDGTLLLIVDWDGHARLLRAPHAEGTGPLKK